MNMLPDIKCDLEAMKSRIDGIDKMCPAMQQMLTQAWQEGFQEGLLKGPARGLAKSTAIGEAGIKAREEVRKRKAAYRLFRLGMPVDQIAEVLNLPAETAAAWIESSESQSPLKRSAA